MAGRPSKISAEVQKDICDALKVGNYRMVACEYAGIAHSTFKDWMARARGTSKRKNGGDQYVAFAAAVKKAEAQAHVRNVTIVQNAGKKYWHASAWWLERKYPKMWGKQERIEHSGEVTTKVQYIEIGGERIEF